ncbi:MAG: hypothetical protein U9P72_02015 [Campylobacterota bacterium]|nr:hypothetical protein [Campylobacterota bacterium]
MYAVEFDTHIENGIVHVLEKYANLQQDDAKITIMISDNPHNNSEISSMSNSSANSIEEWKDNIEDEVWI